MSKKKPEFKASLTDGVLEMKVYQEIGDDGQGGGVSASALSDAIQSAGTYNKIVMRINSPGGDAFEGIAIGNMLKAQGKPIEVCIDGLAASAASIVAMCGDTISMSPNAMVMVHNAWSVAAGNGDELRKMADTLDRVSASIGQTYVKRTGLTADKVKSLMDEETWMSAEEAVAYGFADTISDDDDAEMMAYAKASVKKSKFVEMFKNMPKEFTNKVCACDCEACTNEDCSNCTNKDCEDKACIDCPNQDESGETQEEPTGKAESSNLSQYEARLKLLKLSK